MSSIIPIFIPHVGCPHDCVFCNQKKIAGTLNPPSAEDVSDIIASSLENAKKPAEVAFYGGSFTAIDSRLLNSYLKSVAPFIASGDVSHIRLSTRPDCIDCEILHILWENGVRTIELGAQSMDESVLVHAGRGHTAAHTENAARLIKERGFSLVLQMMTHLPGSDDEKDLETARKIAALSPDAVRVYPTVVIRDTALETLWRNGAYTPATPEDAARLGAQILEIFDGSDIPVIRFGLNPTEDLTNGDALGGAYHPALGEMAQSEKYLRSAICEIEKNSLSGGDITLIVAPSRVSAMSGHKKRNKKILIEKYGFRNIRTVGDPSVCDGEVRIVRGINKA